MRVFGHSGALAQYTKDDIFRIEARQAGFGRLLAAGRSPSSDEASGLGGAAVCLIWPDALLGSGASATNVRAFASGGSSNAIHSSSHSRHMRVRVSLTVDLRTGCAQQ